MDIEPNEYKITTDEIIAAMKKFSELGQVLLIPRDSRIVWVKCLNIRYKKQLALIRRLKFYPHKSLNLNYARRF